MSAKKNQSSGRVTPKGTANGPESPKKERPELPSQPARPGFPVTRGGRQNNHIARPVSHNRGNR